MYLPSLLTGLGPFFCLLSGHQILPRILILDVSFNPVWAASTVISEVTSTSSHFLQKYLRLQSHGALECACLSGNRVVWPAGACNVLILGNITKN